MFSYIFIPASESEPITQMLDSNGGLESDPVRIKATKYFQESKHVVDKEKLREGIREHLANKEGGKQTEVTNDMIDALSSTSSLEIFPLTVPSAELNHIAVSMYCDDKGVAKNLPLNPRATSLCQSCGFSDHIIRGDCFISRYFDDESDWERKDILVSELNPSSEWIIEAKKFNSKKKSQTTVDNFMQFANHAKEIIPKQPGLQKTDWGEWNQSMEDLDVKIIVPNLIKANQVSVVLKTKSLIVKLKGNQENLLNGDLWDKIDVDGSAWSVENEKDNRFICLSLAKLSGSTWPQLFA
eukprot:c6436_g1_i1.p1 GENE.c6436_g1_i1~~c6436_g1_i1.p1  ORF type:complete len:315 (-),score=122.52 c6436_g1_i1:21-911(-)